MVYDLCIRDRETLSFVDGDGFRNFIKREFPGYIIPDRCRITEIFIPDRHTINSASVASLSTAFLNRVGPWRASAAPALTKRPPRGRRRIAHTSSCACTAPGQDRGGTLPEQAGGNWGETTGRRPRTGMRADGKRALSWAGGRCAERGACRARGAAQDRARPWGCVRRGMWRDGPPSARDGPGPRRQTAPARRCVPSRPGKPGSE